MNDRPSATEYLEAVRGFLEQELLPTLGQEPRLRFQTLVAINALSIIGRQLAHEDADLFDEWQQLTGILDLRESTPSSLTALRDRVRTLNVELCEKIKEGAFAAPEANRQLIDVLRHLTVQKLRVANPRYLATQA